MLRMQRNAAQRVEIARRGANLCGEIWMVIGECWKWHGQLRKEDGRAMRGGRYAYRLIYELARGKIPNGVISHHICENPWCVNPWHIKLMPRSAHLHLHGVTGDNHQAKKTHCPAGHPYDALNTYVYKRDRLCKACRKVHGMRYRARKRESK
jgi:hypothetical protein